MEAIDRQFRRQQEAKKRKIIWGGAAGVLFLTALIIGLAVGLTHKSRGGHRQELRTKILVPLYSDPANGSWDP
jgi:hypothetical protein